MKPDEPWPHVCVVGAGAIGGLIGTRLAAAGVPTSALARGATLEALQRNGWRLMDGGNEITAPVRASDDPRELGVADVLLVAVKAQSLGALAPSLQPLIGPNTVVVPAMNGIPWWFCDGLGGPVDGLRLRSVDPDGAIAAAVPLANVVGCVLHVSASTAAPGIAVHDAGGHLILGEPAGTATDRLRRVSEMLQHGGFEVTNSARIRDEIWFKLWGNMTMNPISMLTGTTMDHIVSDDLVASFIAAVMTEAQEIGMCVGTPVPQTVAERMGATRRIGAVRTSMLQDADAGRSIELDALVGATRELGEAVGVPTPFTDALMGLTRVAAQARGLYPRSDQARP